MTATHTVAAQGLSLAYGARRIVNELTVDLRAGEVTAIVGANGCGKSTLLKAIARLLKPESGEVLVDGVPISSQRTRDVARIMSMLPQSPTAPDGILVYDLVARGRHPHRGVFGGLNSDDHRAINEALAMTGVAEVASRPVDELSGGQRQRVWLAMVLAQEADIVLLDEPTTFLDLAHQIDVLDLLVDLNKARGATIIIVLHDLNLATRYADDLIAMRSGAIHARGKPSEIVTVDLVRDVFGLESTLLTDPVSGQPLIVPVGRHHRVT